MQNEEFRNAKSKQATRNVQRKTNVSITVILPDKNKQVMSKKQQNCL
jgi:hypothetical protein